MGHFKLLPLQNFPPTVQKLLLCFGLIFKIIQHLFVHFMHSIQIVHVIGLSSIHISIGIASWSILPIPSTVILFIIIITFLTNKDGRQV